MNTKLLTRFTVILSLMGALAGAAHAETLSVQVPFAFTAAGKSMPAGTYTVDPVSTGVLLIHGITARESAAVRTSAAGYTVPGGKPSLIFNRSSDMPALSSVNMESGLIFTIAPVKRVAVTAALPAKGPVALAHP